MAEMKLSVEERFWSRVDRGEETACWLWTGGKSHGYGMLWKPGRQQALAHRVAYELLVGPIPEGLTLDHLCRNRACVNPAHLEPVTLAENKRRGESPAAQNRRKTHCKHGHEFTPENTRIPARSDGRVSRNCRKCEANRVRSAAGATSGQTKERT